MDAFMIAWAEAIDLGMVITPNTTAIHENVPFTPAIFYAHVSPYAPSKGGRAHQR